MSYDNWKTDPEYGLVSLGACLNCGAERMVSRDEKRRIRRSCDEDGGADDGRTDCSVGCHKTLCPDCIDDGRCTDCGAAICEDHRITVVDEPYCGECAEKLVPALAEIRWLKATIEELRGGFRSISQMSAQQFQGGHIEAFARAQGIADFYGAAKQTRRAA